MKKIIISILLSIAVFVLSGAVFASNEPDLEPTVPNARAAASITNVPTRAAGSGKVNARDAIALVRAVLSGDEEKIAQFDVNGDGKLNSRDVIVMLKEILKTNPGYVLPVQDIKLLDDEIYEREKRDILQLFYENKEYPFYYYDEDYIYISLGIDPRWYVDGRVTTKEDILAMFSEEIRDMFSLVSFYQLYESVSSGKIVLAQWTLHLKYEYRDYLEQVITELSRQECVFTCVPECYSTLVFLEGWERR